MPNNVKKMVKRAMGDKGMDDNGMDYIWNPTPVKGEESDEEETEYIQEVKRSVPESDDVVVDKARFFNLITLVNTYSYTSTSTSTSTIGTVTITGTKSECPSATITDYFKKC